jgi:hypothetical protein
MISLPIVISYLLHERRLRQFRHLFKMQKRPISASYSMLGVLAHVETCLCIQSIQTEKTHEMFINVDLMAIIRNA